jgi:Protein of unknown function (DUF4239)
MLYLTTLPLWLSGLILVIVPTLIAMMGPVFIRQHVGLAQLSNNNEVAGFKFATVGVLYAVLLAFAVIVVWERFSDSESQVAQEAGAAATIYRLADGIQGDAGTALHQRLTDYLEAAISDDWPAMEKGHGSPAATQALNALYMSTLQFLPSSARDNTVLAEVLHQLDLLTQARRARLVATSGIVPGVLWLVLFGGAILTVGFTFFFGTENLYAQAAMTSILAVLIFSGLLIIVTIDRPFAGSVSVRPEALATVLEDLGKK